MKNNTKFIKIYGIILIILFVISIISILLFSSIEGYPKSNLYAGIIISLWYLITGIGILSLKKPGFYLFKFFLFVLFLAFPIGTIISFKSLKYIKKNNVRNCYS
jgi:hypothetical protein